MGKVIKNIFLGISAIISIVVVSKIVGHTPKGLIQLVLYAFPGGILMFLFFDPLLKIFSSQKNIRLIHLNEKDDAVRGISILLVALRWDADPISKQELRNRAAKAVQVVDRQFDKDVMDVKILTIDEVQQYVQLSVRADFHDETEEKQMREALKNKFIENI